MDIPSLEVFKKLDDESIWKYRKEKEDLIKKLGFSYISEAIYHWYFVCGYDAVDIGSLLDVSYNMPTLRIKKWGWSLRLRGGTRYQQNDMFRNLQYIYNSFCKWEGRTTDFYTYIGNQLGISRNTIRYFCNGRTFKDFDRTFKEIPETTHYPRNMQEIHKK